MEIVMDTKQIEELKKIAEDAQANLVTALEKHRKDAVAEVKRLVKQFDIKENEVRTAFPKTKRKRAPNKPKA